MNEKSQKKISSLSISKYRQSHGLFVAEGPHVVESFLAIESDASGGAARWEIEMIIYTDRMAQSAVEASRMGYKTEIVDSRVFQKISDTKSPQGILAVLKIPQFKTSRILAQDRIIIADGISDPGNLGTIIRSAAALGFSGLITTQGSTDIFGPKVVRSSQGALAYLAVLNRASIEQVREMVEGNYQVLELSAKGKTKINDFSTGARRIALIVGSEIKGINSNLQALATAELRIAISDKIESLNASVAAAIAMFYLTHQN
jgi:TrmH family RNA methyltransferase